MVQIERPNAGDFDPVPAYIYGPNRTRLVSGESYLDPVPKKILGPTWIKSPRAMYTNAQENQNHPQSITDLVIEVRVEGGGDKLTSDMWFVHRGMKYFIRGKLDSRYKRGTALYQVRVDNDA